MTIESFSFYNYRCFNIGRHFIKIAPITLLYGSDNEDSKNVFDSIANFKDYIVFDKKINLEANRDDEEIKLGICVEKKEAYKLDNNKFDRVYMEISFEKKENSFVQSSYTYVLKNKDFSEKIIIGKDGLFRYKKNEDNINVQNEALEDNDANKIKDSEAFISVFEDCSKIKKSIISELENVKIIDSLKEISNDDEFYFVKKVRVDSLFNLIKDTKNNKFDKKHLVFQINDKKQAFNLLYKIKQNNTYVNEKDILVNHIAKNQLYLETETYQKAICYQTINEKTSENQILGNESEDNALPMVYLYKFSNDFIEALEEDNYINANKTKLVVLFCQIKKNGLIICSDYEKNSLETIFSNKNFTDNIADNVSESIIILNKNLKKYKNNGGYIEIEKNNIIPDNWNNIIKSSNLFVRQTEENYKKMLSTVFKTANNIILIDKYIKEDDEGKAFIKLCNSMTDSNKINIISRTILENNDEHDRFIITDKFGIALPKGARIDKGKTNISLISEKHRKFLLEKYTDRDVNELTNDYRSEIVNTYKIDENFENSFEDFNLLLSQISVNGFITKAQNINCDKDLLKKVFEKKDNEDPTQRFGSVSEYLKNKYCWNEAIITSVVRKIDDQFFKFLSKLINNSTELYVIDPYVINSEKGFNFLEGISNIVNGHIKCKVFYRSYNYKKCFRSEKYEYVPLNDEASNVVGRFHDRFVLTDTFGIAIPRGCCLNDKMTDISLLSYNASRELFQCFKRIKEAV